jgi:DNA-directed RNA polymerase omega subunit
MAKISSEKAVNAIGNRYDMVLIAAIRNRELNKGYKPKLESQHSNHVTALMEIEEGLVGRDYLKKIR